MTEGSDGALYGTTYGAANRYAGTVFRMNKDGAGYRALHTFSLADGDGRRPYGAVIEATDGVLYGMTRLGGDFGRGTVFRLNKDGSGYAILHNFTASPNDGAAPLAELLQASDGLLYGTTSFEGDYSDGTIFRLNKDGSSFQVLHHFQGRPADGSLSHAGLIEGPDGTLYGVTVYGGASDAGCIFKLKKDGSDYSILYSFGATADDGRSPIATPTLSRQGVLYGCTSEGGIVNGRGTYGTLFRISTDGSKYGILHKFAGPPDDGITPWGSLLEGSDGLLYGTALGGGAQSYGAVFKISPDGGSCTVLHDFTDREVDGIIPKAGLIQSKDGTLYGTTEDGGASNDGTAFKINTDGSGYSVLHNFSFGGGDGVSPLCLLVGTNGTLYGATQMGGSHNDGAVFKLKPDGTDYHLLHSFTFEGGRVPLGISALVGGHLYGTTYQGGTNDLGTVFKLAEDGSDFSVLRYFGESPGAGAHPRAGLLSAQDGMLYGTTADNSADGGAGELFSVDPRQNNFSVVYTFGSIDGDGQNPFAALIEGADGLVYGTTYDGGTTGYGTAFRLNKNGNGYTILHNFTTLGGDGQNPGQLVEASDGMLYGTTYYGGVNGSGTIYRLAKDGSDYRVLYSFAGGPFNANPGCPVWEGDDGALYGTTLHGGPENAGTIFRVNKGGSDFEVLHTFSTTGNDGYQPSAGLVRGPDGALYGATYYGGEFGLGTVFRLWPPQTPDIIRIAPNNGAITVVIAGAPNYHYQLLRSTDLKNWIVLAAVTMPSQGLYSYDDSSPVDRAAFYRAVWNP